MPHQEKSATFSPMQLMDGRAAAEALRAKLVQRIESLKARGVVPTLAIVQVDDDERTVRYVRAKTDTAAALGITIRHIALDPHQQAATLDPLIRERLAALNADPNVHGILLQLPLPHGLDSDELINMIAPAKDVDGLTATNQAALDAGRELLVPATPLGILRLLEAYHVPIAGSTIAVIGQGLVVGKPLATMLRSRGATVRTADASTSDLHTITRGADIVISATGQPNLISPDLITNTTVLIDAGLAEAGSGLVGDTTEAAREKARLTTPVRGGVGPMTVASLLGNVVLAAEYQTLATA